MLFNPLCMAWVVGYTLYSSVLYWVQCAVLGTVCCTGYSVLYGVQCAVLGTVCCTGYSVLYRVQCAVPGTACCTGYSVLYGVQCACAADFSLLNLPKGKSLGRSKPATNS
jgi:hypothetical protein